MGKARGVQAATGRARGKSSVRRALEERNKLVLEYLPLARWHAERFSRRYPAHIDDLESDAVCGLMQAAETWVSGAGSRADSWFSRRIVGAMYDGFRARRPFGRTRRRDSETPVVYSMFGEIKNVETERLADTLADTWDAVSAVESEDRLEYLMRGLSPRERRALNLFLCGHTQREIANTISTSQSAVCLQIRDAKNRLRDVFKDRAAEFAA